MDYEKAYKEALERAKSLIDKEGLTEGSYPNRNACEAIFPELAESEDEKNANALIRLLNNDKVSSLMTYEAKQQWLNWLERKKTPSVSFESAAGFNSGSAVVYHNDDSEDERIKKGLVNFLQSPFIKETLIDEKVAPWIAYLEKQKEQKPAEWSEEDEKIRKTLLDYYEEALDNYTNVEWLNGITYGELCNWLKSLRPQPYWKPSEEQMEALLWCTAHLGGADHRVLAELYEQLKRL